MKKYERVTLNNVLISSLTISFTETKLAVFPTYWFFRLFSLTLFSLRSIIFKKLANLQKFKYLLRYLVIKQKMCKNLHIFEKPLTQRIQMCKNICKMYIQEKLKMCKFPSKAYVQKSVQNFFAKLCNLLAFVQGFPKNYKMLKSIDWK